ncbi:conserved hypothetical protein [Leptospira interrogans serovar Manilae]|uniref:Uncharacterized protein n=1 Tax=Leptospira interrogans serovar Manilae TaxID=214675 RepID=A0AAQ1SN50_LEPIR|nr:conserved hypothetical protein [Leptospira interrogans serovar Manilae]
MNSATIGKPDSLALVNKLHTGSIIQQFSLISIYYESETLNLKGRSVEFSLHRFILHSTRFMLNQSLIFVKI